MGDLLTPADVEKMAARAGVTMAELCRRAGVAKSIFHRWKAGETAPNMRNYLRIRDAAETALAEAKPPPRRKRTPSSATIEPRRKRTPAHTEAAD